MKISRISVLCGTAAAFCGLSVSALDITITDQYAGQSTFTPTSPASNPATKVEDQSTEPGTINNQTWDLEAFSLSNGKLSVIAGFDMKSGWANANGNNTPQYQTPIGDIFIRVGSQVDAHNVSGAGGDSVGFGYVIHFPATPDNKPFADSNYWTPGSGTVAYEVYSSSQVTLIATGNASVEGGNALLSDWLWQAVPKTGEKFLYNGFADYADNKSDEETLTATGINLAGGNHDILSNIVIDSSLLGGASSLYYYITMGCGNDILEGHSVPDGGATVLLMGVGLTGIALIRRRATKA